MTSFTNSIQSFVKKWHNKPLEDSLYYVSKEYNSFQNAFKKQMGKICQEIGATLDRFEKGHYEIYGYIARDGKFVYFSFGSYFCNRATPDLLNNNNMLCRTAKDEKDYRGGDNCFTSFADCKDLIDALLNKEHKGI